MSSASMTVPSPAWRSISPGTGFEHCINFFGEFSEGLANHALKTIHTTLEQQGTHCYCLRLEVDAENQGYFHSYGDLLVPHSQIAVSQPFVGRVPLRNLVPDLATWEQLAIRVGPPLAALNDPAIDVHVRDFLRRVSWQIAIRLQDNEKYVGYFKFMGVDGSPVPKDRDVVAAAYKAKTEVANLLAYRHVQETRADEIFKERLRTTAYEISSLVLDGRLALRHVADMLTSHLGAGWNRAACYWPVSADKLRCMWAHGGGGDWSWCKVQGDLSAQVREVEQLTEGVRRHPYPLDDTFYLSAAGERPVEVAGINDPGNQNILASLWRAQGDIRRLPAEHQFWESSPDPDAHLSVVNRRKIRQNGPRAAEFRQQDPWVQEVQAQRPKSPIFASKNGRYFAVPWFSQGELIAIWVVDMAYWGKLEVQPGAPSLALTHEILDTLGPAMNLHRRGAFPGRHS
jgi:hypothetical protein